MKPYNKFPDPTKYKESAYIGEELFDDPEYELGRTCECVQRCVERRIFNLDHALELYKVTNEQYERFLSKSEDKIPPISNVKAIR